MDWIIEITFKHRALQLVFNLYKSQIECSYIDKFCVVVTKCAVLFTTFYVTVVCVCVCVNSY